MTTHATTLRHQLLNKVPEVTLWFWIIKILCTTVGESFADYINVNLGVGLVPTAVIFTVAFAAILAAQLRSPRYVPWIYWLTVVVVSVTGTLYTDILTDQAGVPLWISTSIFSVLLAVVFGVWWLRERTLSIHSIVTLPREAFYWVAVLVTFALGTATGDWTLELTGWGPGKSVLLPLGLIAITTGLWKLGANPVLSFWVAYILTRPLGANIGDFLATPTSEKGLGLGTLGTSVVFLVAIAGTVVYLTTSHVDVVDPDLADTATATGDPGRERLTLGAFVLVASATFALLAYTNSQPHVSALDDESGSPAASCAGGPLDQASATRQVGAAFPADQVAGFATISHDTLDLVAAGDQAGAATRITDLETSWDDAEPDLVAQSCGAWTFVDGQIDDVLTQVRASGPDAAGETSALQALLATLD